MAQNVSIPKHWKLGRVGEYVISVKGKKPKRISAIRTPECPIPYVNIKAFEKNVIDEYTDGVGCILCEEGDFLMVWDGSRSGYVGKAINGALGSTLVKLNFPNIDNNYAYYFLQSKYIEINTKAKGVGIPHVDPNILWNYKLPIPPLPEQLAIVSKIEELLSDLENGKQQLLLAQQQLKVYRQSLLKWAFEGKLTNDICKEGEFPKSWKWVRFGELFHDTPQNGLYKPSSQYGSGIPILRIDGFYEGIILNDYEYKRVRLTKEETEKYSLSINDIVVNRVNSMSHLGKCGLVKTLNEQTVFESNVMKIKIREERALPQFISIYLSSSTGIKELTKNAKHAVNQASINQTDVSNALIPLPTLEEQHIVVYELESKLSVCNKIEETINHSLQQSETLRQSILKKAFEGELIKLIKN